MKKEEVDKVEDYLVDVTNRFCDVSESLEALYVVINHERRELIQNGQAFAYQQGIIDVVTELRDYAAGERDLQEEKEKLKKDINGEVQGRDPEEDLEGYT